MSYVLEKIGSEGRKRVDADVGPDWTRIMDKRHFWVSSDGNVCEKYWAIDRESGNYLMLSRGLLIGLPGGVYFFIFHSKMYPIHVVGIQTRMVNFFAGQKPSKDEYEEFKQELTRAFAVYGESGRPSKAVFVPAFPEEI